jgi:hypothetical protein
LRPPEVGVLRQDLQAEGGEVIVCRWCHTTLEPKDAIPVKSSFGCRQELWQECHDRMEATYQSHAKHLLKKKAA